VEFYPSTTGVAMFTMRLKYGGSIGGMSKITFPSGSPPIMRYGLAAMIIYWSLSGNAVVVATHSNLNPFTISN